MIIFVDINFKISKFETKKYFFWISKLSDLKVKMYSKTLICVQFMSDLDSSDYTGVGLGRFELYIYI